LWQDVVLQEVKELPSTIDGMSAFELANVEKKEVHNTLKDGTRWKKTAPQNGKGTCKFATQTGGGFESFSSRKPYLPAHSKNNQKCTENKRTHSKIILTSNLLRSSRQLFCLLFKIRWTGKQLKKRLPW